jgi:LPXTG-motif cell wall-anchored protein
VEVTPIVANDETTTTFTFPVNSWIKKGEYSFETSTKTASLRGTRLDLHEFLTQTDEKSYLIKVNKGYVIEQEIVEYIQEQGICVTFEIYNEKGICFYSVIVDGTAINRAETINTALTIEKKDNIFAVFINDKKGLPSGVMVKINRSELQAELVDSNIVDEYKDLYVLEKSATAGFIKVKKITDDEEVVVDSFNSEGTAYLSHHEVYDEESEQDESDEDVSKDEEPEQDESDEDTSKNEELSTEDTPATGDASNQTVYLLALLMLGMTIYVFGKKKKYDSV